MGIFSWLFKKKDKFIDMENTGEKLPDFKFCVIPDSEDYRGFANQEDIACGTGYKAKSGKYLYTYLESDQNIKLFIKKRSFKPCTPVETNEELLERVEPRLTAEGMNTIINNIYSFVDNVSISYVKTEDDKIKKIYHIHFDNIQDKYLRFFEAYLVLDDSLNTKRALSYLNLLNDLNPYE